MLAIFKREVRSYFQNIIGWLFVALVFAVYGLYFYAYNLRAGYPYITYSLSAVSIILLIAIPILTMRCFSEEQKSKTDQLMLTSPVSVGKIVLGKYLAMVAVFSIDMVIVCITPIIMSFLGTVPVGECYVAVLGFWLYGCACIAIGMFISSITESAVIAAVVSFIALFLCYMESSISSLVFSDNNALSDVIGCIDLFGRFEKFTSGCLDITGIVYYLSVIFLFCFWTAQKIQRRRFEVNRQRLFLGAFSSGIIVVITAVVVLFNLITNSLPTSLTAIDCSYTKMYSITDQTKKFLSSLEDDITIYVLAASNDKDDQLDRTLNSYKDLSSHIYVNYINVAKNPYFYQKYTDEAPTTNSLIVVDDSKSTDEETVSRVVDYSDIYVYETSYDYSTYESSSELTGYDAEGQITSAIEYVTKDSSELPKVYQITGHGETSLGSDFTDVIKKANVNTESLDLFNASEIPSDATAIIINAPKESDFNEDEAKLVIEYLQNGGNAIICGDYESSEYKNFNSILEAYNVAIEKGVIVENESSMYYQYPLYLLPSISQTDYTSDITDANVFMPNSTIITYPGSSASLVDSTESTETDTKAEATVDGQTVDEEETESDDKTAYGESTYTELLTTSSSAVFKTNIDSNTFEKEDGDLEGQFVVGLAIETQIDENTTGKIVVFSNSYVLTDDTNDMVSGAHSAMFSDIVSALVGDSDLASSVIPTKEVSVSNITVASLPATVLGLGSAIILPIIGLFAGIFIWVRRRRK